MPTPSETAAELNERGIALAKDRQLTAAADLFRQAIAVDPTFALAHRNLGHAHTELGQKDEAIVCYEEVLKLEPRSVEALNNLGMLRSQKKDYAGAITALNRAVALAPDYAPGFNNLGIALSAAALHPQAIAAFRRALALSPDSPEAHNNLGLALAEGGWPDQAIAHCQRAIALKPDYADAHTNLGIALADAGRIDEALRQYQQAIDLNPQSTAAVRMNRAKALLLKGDWEAGWRDYEFRHHKEENIRVKHDAPRWDGLPLAGRTLLLEAEQGMGDTIQFVRLGAEIKRRHEGQVILAVEPALLPVLAKVAGIDWLVSQAEPRPKFDVWSPLLSVPAHLNLDPAELNSVVPYLQSNEARTQEWQKRLAKLPGVKIGIAWQGNRFNKMDRRRSFLLSSFAPLGKLRGLTLISLQKDAGNEQLDTLGEFEIVSLGSNFDEGGGAFLDTAAVMKNLDLVITADTSVAHLAGALGVPVWVPVSFSPDWRWGLSRESTPWYSTMRLFRQTQLRDWPGVFDRIAVALQERFPQLRPRKPAEFTLATSGFNRLARTRHGPLLYNRHDAYIGKSLAELGEFSEGETDLFRQSVRPGAIVVEAGANIGAHTIALARLAGEAGIVHAIEPQRIVFQTLCGNVALCGLTNVHCHQAAVGDHPGTIVVPTFDFNRPNNFGGLSLGKHQAGERVPVITIDGLSLRRCDLLKIDVEGMELSAIRGAAETIRHCRPVLYVENDRPDNSPQLIEALFALDYKLFWHAPRYYNRNNYYANAENTFGNLASLNMLCIHNSVATDIQGLKPITSATSDWREV